MNSRSRWALLSAFAAALPHCATSSKGTSAEPQDGAAIGNTEPQDGSGGSSAGGSSAGGSSTGAASAGGSSTGAACSPGTRIAAGQSEHTLESGGVSRRLVVHLPAGHEASEALPVVFTLHGSGGTPEAQLMDTGLVPVADAKGFVLVAPAGLDNFWNVPPDPNAADDVRFISDAIDLVASLVCVDRQRVFVTGFSGGARMSSQLACDLSSRIAAVAAIGGVRFPGPCSQARPFPILAFHGTGDDVNPYDGGGRPEWQTSVESAVDGWAQHNSCGARSEQEVAPGIDRLSYASCTEVALYRIAGFGHSWPGAITSEASANDLIWSFFERHPLP
jgi:polyhydroxybutyrate depolymerase